MPQINQPNDNSVSEVTHQNLASQTGDNDEQDWWGMEYEPGNKQPRGRGFGDSYAERIEKPRKRGKAHSRRGLNSHDE